MHAMLGPSRRNACCNSRPNDTPGVLEGVLPHVSLTGLSVPPTMRRFVSLCDVMSRICPNCQLPRPADSSAPDWQCPSCGKAYNKGAGAPVDSTYGKSTYLPPVKTPFRERSPLVRMLIASLFLGWIVLYYWPNREESASTTVGAQPVVVMYATSWCGYCAQARSFFAANGIQYEERDIEKSSSFHEEHRRLGGQGVPLILVGEEKIGGFNEGRLRSLLKPWIKS